MTDTVSNWYFVHFFTLSYALDVNRTNDVFWHVDYVNTLT